MSEVDPDVTRIDVSGVFPDLSNPILYVHHCCRKAVLHHEGDAPSTITIDTDKVAQMLDDIRKAQTK